MPAQCFCFLYSWLLQLTTWMAARSIFLNPRPDHFRILLKNLLRLPKPQGQKLKLLARHWWRDNCAPPAASPHSRSTPCPSHRELLPDPRHAVRSLCTQAMSSPFPETFASCSGLCRVPPAPFRGSAHVCRFSVKPLAQKRHSI